jgi:hypothetical protein
MSEGDNANDRSHKPSKVRERGLELSKANSDVDEMLDEEIAATT